MTFQVHCFSACLCLSIAWCTSSTIDTVLGVISYYSTCTASHYFHFLFFVPCEEECGRITTVLFCFTLYSPVNFPTLFPFCAACLLQVAYSNHLPQLNTQSQPPWFTISPKIHDRAVRLTVLQLMLSASKFISVHSTVCSIVALY